MIGVDRKWLAEAQNGANDPKPVMAAVLILLALAIEHQVVNDGKWPQTMMRSRVIPKRLIAEVAATSIFERFLEDFRCFGFQHLLSHSR